MARQGLELELREEPGQRWLEEKAVENVGVGGGKAAAETSVTATVTKATCYPTLLSNSKRGAFPSMLSGWRKTSSLFQVNTVFRFRFIYCPMQKDTVVYNECQSSYISELM